MGPRSSSGLNEETIPGRRVRSGGGGLEEPGRPGDTSIPLYAWFLGVVVVLMVLAMCGLWALYALRGQWAVSGPTPTPIIWTPTPRPTPSASPTPTPGETETVPTVSPDIAIGRYVRVTGTEGTGLSLREGPGANYPRTDVALDGELFIVVEGPTVAGETQWWRIRDPDNEERFWWAAGNYLEPVERP